MSPNIQLTYFNTPGIAEFIRMMLKYGGLDFEDIRIEREDWPEIKPTMPFGTVPLYEEDGKCISQSLAIGRYVAKKVKLAGDTDWEILEINAVLDTINDFKAKLTKVFFIPKDDPSRETEVKNLMVEVLPFYMERLDKLAKENNGYLVAKKLTVADFFFTTCTDYIKDAVEKYENLKVVRRNVYELPAIKQWVAVRPEFEYLFYKK